MGTQGHGSGHVMYDRGVWFLKEIMSSSRALRCMQIMICKIFTCLEINYQFHLLSWPFFSRAMYNKTAIGKGFCDIQNNQGLGKGYQSKPKIIPTYNSHLLHQTLFQKL